MTFFILHMYCTYLCHSISRQSARTLGHNKYLVTSESLSCHVFHKNLLITATKGGKLSVWEVERNDEKQIAEPVKRFEQESKVATDQMACCDDILVCADQDRTLRFWDMKDWVVIRRVSHYNRTIRSIYLTQTNVIYTSYNKSHPKAVIYKIKSWDDIERTDSVRLGEGMQYSLNSFYQSKNKVIVSIDRKFVIIEEQADKFVTTHEFGCYAWLLSHTIDCVRMVGNLVICLTTSFKDQAIAILFFYDLNALEWYDFDIKVAVGGAYCVNELGILIFHQPMRGLFVQDVYSPECMELLHWSYLLASKGKHRGQRLYLSSPLDFKRTRKDYQYGDMKSMELHWSGFVTHDDGSNDNVLTIHWFNKPESFKNPEELLREQGISSEELL